MKMDLPRKRKDSKAHSKKDRKLKKLISKSDSDSDESEHELSYYLNDRVKLMKEVLKIIKPKKIKSMAPECIQNLDNEEINSMLLEELLGISNKRLKYIFNGQNLEEDSSSTDPEAEQQPIDVISLDDITDDDFVIDLDSENDEKRKRHKKRTKVKIKQECRRKRIKKEKQDQDNSSSSKKSKDPVKDKMNEQNLMSVLELLELQARARAIRSQLALENNRKVQEQGKNETTETKTEESDHDDAIIIESPRNIEIIITSSESETEELARNGSSKRSSSRQERDCRENGNANDMKKQNSKENESSPTVSNATKEDVETLESGKEENKPVQVGENGDDTIEKSCEREEVAIVETPLEDDNQSESRNKITNIETIIISPAKDSTIDKDKAVNRRSQKLKKSKLENEQSNDDSECDNAKVSKASKSEAKDDSDTSEVSKTQRSLADEGDGIIINMEQSEIDCIISD